MLDKNIIRPSSSPWASPVGLVKKDGLLCFFVDFRKLNSLTRKDAYALPRIDDTLNSLAGLKWFTNLDLASRYWQVEICPEDKEKTAFCTHDGHFEFNVMRFGLCNECSGHIPKAHGSRTGWGTMVMYTQMILSSWGDHLRSTWIT